MSKSQKQVLAVGGIQLNVFSPLSDPGKMVGGVAVLFLLHGRSSKADDLEATATKLVEKSEDRRRSVLDETALNLVVVTFVSRLDDRQARRLIPRRRTGPEESWCQNNQPSRQSTVEPQSGGK